MTPNQKLDAANLRLNDASIKKSTAYSKLDKAIEDLETSKRARDHIKDEVTRKGVTRKKDGIKKAYDTVKHNRKVVETTQRKYIDACARHSKAQADYDELSQEIAKIAGVPEEYCDDVCVVVKDGAIHILFGDRSSQDRSGHYIMTAACDVTHEREPRAPHGRMMS